VLAALALVVFDACDSYPEKNIKKLKIGGEVFFNVTIAFVSMKFNIILFY